MGDIWMEAGRVQDTMEGYKMVGRNMRVELEEVLWVV